MLFNNLFASLALVVPAVTAAELPLRVISFNIRYAASDPGENEEPWSVRQPLVSDLISGVVSDAPALVGLQEVLHEQLVDLKSALGDGWSHIGVGRDDGKEAGEYSPILYRSDIFDVIFEETKWLSETPDEPSFGWGANNRRVVTTGVFEHKETKQRLIRSNTHLDHEVSEARIEGVKIIIERLKVAQGDHGPLAVALTGDFNSQPDQDAHEEMAKIGYLDDLYDVAAERKGPEDTFTGFAPGTAQTRIDYIYIGPKGENKWVAKEYEVLDNQVDGVFASDHRPVVGDLALTG